MGLNQTRRSADQLHESPSLSANPATSDEVLIGRIANGDRLAMQVLFARHHVRVYRFVLRLVRNEAAAEDLISEVFLDVWRQAGRFASSRFPRCGASRSRNWMKRRRPRSRILRTPPT
jgi:RNA polymerase sigma-70 factor (ECF subfamily)